MLLWYTKPSSSGTYTQRKTPSSYKIDWEDLDANSYRSIATGNLIDTVISKKWSKLQFSYNCLSKDEVNTLMTEINKNPMYVKAMNPLFSGGYIEAQFRCSKANAEMLENGEYKLSFNLVQKKKVSGQ
jgi:hypothetical protein